MRRLNIVNHLDDESLARKGMAAQGTPESARWLVLNLIQVGGFRAADDLVRLSGMSKTRVYLTIRQYNKLGVAGVAYGRRGGRRRSLLSLQEEGELLHSFHASAEVGQIKTVFDIKQRVCRKIGFSVSDDYLWDLFRRHGWEKRMAQTDIVSMTNEGFRVAKSKSVFFWQPPAMQQKIA